MHYLKIQGSNHATGTERDKEGKGKGCRKGISNTMVEPLTHYLKIQGSNPATGTEREKKGKDKGCTKGISSTVVETLTHYLKIQGSYPATGTEREKEGKDKGCSKCIGSTVVETLMHYLKIQSSNNGCSQWQMQHSGRAFDTLPFKIYGSNHVTGTEKDKEGKGKGCSKCIGSTMVETLTHNVKIYGSNTTTAIGRETEQK